MTTTMTDDLTTVYLPQLVPVRATEGDVRYPMDGVDGEALHLLIDSPYDVTAIEICGGEVAWWTVCDHLRYPHPDAHRLPAGVTAQRVEDEHRWIVTGPGGSMLVRRGNPPGTPGPSRRERARALWVDLCAT